MVYPLVQQIDARKFGHPFQDIQVNILLQGVGPASQDKPDEYDLAQINYDFEGDSYALQLKDWPKKENRQVIQDTKPHQLRSFMSRAVTLNDRLFIIHNLCQKDDSQSKTAFKHPIRIMDFETTKLNTPIYLNDDS